MNRGCVRFRFALLVPTVLTCCSPRANERSPDLQNTGSQNAEGSAEPEPVADDIAEPVAGQATAQPTPLGAVLLVTDIAGQPVGGNSNSAPSFSLVGDSDGLARVRTLIDRIEVEFVVGSPEAGPPEECGMATSLSYPYAFARVERSALPYRFSVREEVAQCEEPRRLRRKWTRVGTAERPLNAAVLSTQSSSRGL